MANDNRGGQQRVELHWTAWQPHEGCWLGERLPRLPGLYRIRRVGRNDVDYIGQTGLTLCERQGMLRGVYDERGMPYRDPHTAGPALWALHQAPGCAFEISVMPYTGSHTMRMGLEAVAIAQYRQAHRCSPTIQFGRMPKGYRKSSSNNRQLEAAGKRFRGVPTTGEDASHLSGIPPVGPLSGDPEGPGWCGHAWSAWMTAADVVRVIPSGANGLYRLRVSGRAGLVYVGQGVMCSRIEQHLRKAGKPDEPQGAVFRADTECSWALNDAWHGHRGAGVGKRDPSIWWRNTWWKSTPTFFLITLRALPIPSRTERERWEPNGSQTDNTSRIKSVFGGRYDRRKRMNSGFSGTGGHSTAISKTAGCRLDSCPTCQQECRNIAALGLLA